MPLADEAEAPTPDVAVVVVSYGSADLLERNLVRLDDADARVVVVDNFTTGAERSRIRTLADAHGWDAVLNEGNPGFGGGFNAGAERALAAGAQVLVALNPDAQIEPDALGALAAAARADPAALVSPTILDEAGRTYFGGADLYLDDGTTAGAQHRDRHAGRPRLPWATGACFAVSRQLWQRTGGFDDDYFLYWEDIDLSHRVLEAGGRLEQRGDIDVRHEEGQTHGRRSGDRAKSATYYRYNIRNRTLYAVKRLDPKDRRRWLVRTPRVALDVVLRGGRRQLLTSAAPWRGLARGLADVVVLARRPGAPPPRG